MYELLSEMNLLEPLVEILVRPFSSKTTYTLLPDTLTHLALEFMPPCPTTMGAPSFQSIAAFILFLSSWPVTYTV